MTSETKLPIEIWDIAKVTPYPKNAKIHSPDQIKSLATLINKFGWTQPIVVDADGIVIVGHGRRLAALSLGLTKIPVVHRKDLTKSEADAMRLGDNRVTSTEYDMDAMQAELMRLSEAGADMLMTAFSDQELAFLTEDLGDIDDAAFTSDIGDAVETQREANSAKTAEVDESAAPVADALGFKRVKVSESRELRGYMAKIEAKTGLAGVAALLAHFAATVS